MLTRAAPAGGKSLVKETSGCCTLGSASSIARRCGVVVGGAACTALFPQHAGIGQPKAGMGGEVEPHKLHGYAEAQHGQK